MKPIFILIAVFWFLFMLKLLAAPPKKCHIAHIEKCSAKECTVVCADGVKCVAQLPVEWGTAVECKNARE